MSSQLKIAGAFGLTALFVTFTCILFAIASWPQFSWTNNALSDLGVQNGATELIFNSGTIVGGALFAVFAAGLYRFSDSNPVGKLGAAVFMLACVMLISIGVFNEHCSPTHYVVSVGFFTLLPISLLIFVAAFLVQGRHKLSVFTLGIGVFAAAVWVTEFTVRYAPGVAIPEFVSGFAGAMWVAVLSLLMLKGSSNATL